jgi:ubiquinone/menaquinone biosynthesis C-methylase UbiE
MAASDNRAYYDAFAPGYDARRDVGYHKLIDDQAAELVRRVGEGGDVVEVGCGTGLVLQRVQGFAASACGVDLSPGMLEKARARGLDVREGDATALPFADASFDVAYSFKVLAHVPELDRALAEMARVVRPGGHLVYDVYNRASLRWLIKRLTGPRATSTSFDEAAIATRFWSVDEARRRIPPGTRVVSISGIRIATVHPSLLRLPGLGRVAERVEWGLMDTALARFAGFVVLTLEKQG